MHGSPRAKVVRGYLLCFLLRAHSRYTPSSCPIGHNGCLWLEVVQTTSFSSFNQDPIGPWAFFLGLGWSEPLVTFLWTKMVQSTSQEPYPIEHSLPLLGPTWSEPNFAQPRSDRTLDFSPYTNTLGTLHTNTFVQPSIMSKVPPIAPLTQTTQGGPPMGTSDRV